MQLGAGISLGSEDCKKNSWTETENLDSNFSHPEPWTGGQSFIYSFNRNSISNDSIPSFVMCAGQTINKTDIVPGLMEITFW